MGFVASIKGIPSHKIVADGLTMLHRLDHRGGRAADGTTSDGAGIMLGLPHEFFNAECKKQGVNLPKAGNYGVGKVFLPQDAELQAWSIKMIEDVLEDEDLQLLCWRDVPVDSSVLGPIAKSCEPKVKQVFVTGDLKHLSWRMFVARKVIEVKAREKLGLEQKQVYFCSFSTDTIIYKGLLLSSHILLLHRTKG